MPDESKADPAATDPFWAPVRRRHPDVDIVLLPPEQAADEPTDQPPDEPTDQPTDEPTDQPPDEPIDQPTDGPTDQPPADPGLLAVGDTARRW